MKSITFTILVGWLFFVNPATSLSCDPPQIIYSNCNGGNAVITFKTNAPPGLLGFKLYRNGEFLEYLTHTGDSVYTHFFTDQPPGIHVYCVTAVCETAE